MTDRFDTGSGALSFPAPFGGGTPIAGAPLLVPELRHLSTVRPVLQRPANVHFSSARDEWPTPKVLFDELNWIFGGFTLDPCATRDNAKCERFFTREDDGLVQRWDGKVFMNPPYGRSIERWVRKAFEESVRGALVVCLLPARTDTRWWQDYVKRDSHVREVLHLMRSFNAVSRSSAARNPAPESAVYATSESHEVLTVAEVACALRCSRAHVFNLLSGKVRDTSPLPSVRIGRRRIIRRTTLKQWIEANEICYDPITPNIDAADA